jgi:hypothetical protein
LGSCAEESLARKNFYCTSERRSHLVHEPLIDDDPRNNAFGLLMSLNKLIETNGGFDYTGADCSARIREVGFETIRVEYLVGADSMVIGVK